MQVEDEMKPTGQQNFIYDNRDYCRIQKFDGSRNL